jgi:hypothetical protein
VAAVCWILRAEPLAIGHMDMAPAQSEDPRAARPHRQAQAIAAREVPDRALGRPTLSKEREPDGALDVGPHGPSGKRAPLEAQLTPEADCAGIEAASAGLRPFQRDPADAGARRVRGGS